MFLSETLKHLIPYDHTLHRERKRFCHHYFHAFSTGKILNVKLKIALKSMVNKGQRCLKR